MNGRVIGVDLGSVSAKFAVLENGLIVEEGYMRHRGDPVAALMELLSSTPVEGWETTPVSLTGSGAQRLARFLGVQPVNEVVALAAAVRHFVPGAGSVVEMGGQDSKLLQFRHDGDDMPVFDDFATNTICAAGTGSFLDQQAARLGLTPEEMGALAENCAKPPRIAGRCSVFAKSDMIHLQQIGATVTEIASGLCFAVARNFRSTIAAGREFRGPVAFVGGGGGQSGNGEGFSGRG
jgi:predicted CoA-substrate-specific enzyme activase